MPLYGKLLPKRNEWSISGTSRMGAQTEGSQSFFLGFQILSNKSFPGLKPPEPNLLLALTFVVLGMLVPLPLSALCSEPP